MFKSMVKTIICLTLLTLISACTPAATDVVPTATTVPLSPTAIPPTAKPTEAPAAPPPPTATATPEPSPTATTPPTPTATPPAVSIAWQQTYRASGSEVVHDVLMAEDGGYYLVGTTNLVFEPEENGDVYLIKTDAAGKKLWEKTYGGDRLEEGNSILPTNDGQLMIIGYTASFDASGIDVYMLKVDHDGNELWSKTFGGPLDEMGGGRQLADGGFILGGNIVDPNDIVADPGAAGYGGYAGRSNIFITQTDGDGNPLWTQTFGGEQNVMATTGIQSPDGGFVILASIIAYPEPGNHIYLLKVDANGQEVWSRTWADDDASGYDLVPTSGGGYLLTGSYLPPGSEKEDFLFVKTDAEGNEVWRSTFGDPDMIDYAVVLTEAADGGYVAAGEWVKDYYSGDSDLSLVKIDAQGQLVWREKIETNAHHMLARILPHPDGGYVIATSIVSSSDFEFDVMLIKIGVPVSAVPANTAIPGTISAETASQTQLLRKLDGHSGRVNSLVFSGDGIHLASSSQDRGEIKLWDVRSGQEVHTFSTAEMSLNGVAFSPDGRLLASADAIWDVESRQVMQTLEQNREDAGVVAFSPDGAWLATSLIGQPIKLWDVASGKVVRSLEIQTDDIALKLVLSLAFSPDGALLAAGSGKGTIRLWDVASGQIAATLEYGGDMNDVHGMAFSPDGNTLASTGTDGLLRLWDVASRQLIQTLRHGDGVFGVAYSPDGTILATVGDGPVKLWNVASGRQVRSLSQNDAVVAAAFSPDGALLASGGYDHLIYLWSIPQ